MALLASHIFWALVFALLVGVAEHYWGMIGLLGASFAFAGASLVEIRWRVWTRTFLRFIALLKVIQTGLKGAYPRTDTLNTAQFVRIFLEAKEGDELLLIGRTHLSVLKDSDQLMADAIKAGTVRNPHESVDNLLFLALQNGARVRMLLLDRRAIVASNAARRIDLKSLGLRDSRESIAGDLSKSERALEALRARCQEENVSGSLEVFRTTAVVENSAIIYIQRRDEKTFIHVTYDFSFGVTNDDKFSQYYRIRYREGRNHFCVRLWKSYEAKLLDEATSFAYEFCYRPSTVKPTAVLERIATERLQDLIAKHAKGEAIRHNSLNHVLPVARRVLKSLHAHAPLEGPVSAQLEITNKCSTHCEHCTRYSHTDDSSMDFSLACHILSELRASGTKTITLSGGEPTQHVDFARILKHAHEIGLEVGVLSNGVGLDDKVVRAIQDHAHWLRLSVDGSAPSVYSKVRTLAKSADGPVDAFAAVSEVVTKFRDSKAAGCKLQVCYTIQTANITDVPEMIRWARRTLINGDRDLTFKFVHGAGGNFLCTKGELDWFRKAVIEDPDFQNAANVPYLRAMLAELGVYGITTGRPTDDLYSQMDTRCFTPFTFTLIDVVGDVYPCCFLYEDNSAYTPATIAKRRRHRLGTMSASTKFLDDIWRGDAYRSLRDDLRTIEPAVERFSRCGECSRHCVHNHALSLIEKEYVGLRSAGGDADAVLGRLGSDGLTWF